MDFQPWDVLEIKIKFITNYQDDPKPLICIDGPDFSYSRQVGLYSSGDAVGIQVCEGMDEEYYMNLCDRIASAAKKMYLDRLPVDEALKAPTVFFDERDNSEI